MAFKVRYETKGAHVHCTLFYRLRDDGTWQNCGRVIVDAGAGFDELRATSNLLIWEPVETDRGLDDYRV